MKVTQIPFVELLGIEEENNTLSLAFKEDVLNHVESIHASAQFTLAETQSGLYLQELFPDLVGKVIPLLRESKIKYKKPALQKLFAYASVGEDAKEKFLVQFLKKSRASIEVNIDIKDIEGTLTAQATFTWFVQKI